MSDRSSDHEPSGTWLSYADAGVRLRLSPEAVRLRARRAGWRRMPGNDGRTLILVPDRADEQSDGRPAVRPTVIETLSAAVDLLREQLQAERTRADSDRARADAAEVGRRAAEARAERAEQRADAAEARAAEVDRQAAATIQTARAGAEREAARAAAEMEQAREALR